MPVSEYVFRHACTIVPIVDGRTRQVAIAYSQSKQNGDESHSNCSNKSHLENIQIA